MNTESNLNILTRKVVQKYKLFITWLLVDYTGLLLSEKQQKQSLRRNNFEIFYLETGWETNCGSLMNLKLINACFHELFFKSFLFFNIHQKVHSCLVISFFRNELESFASYSKRNFISSIMMEHFEQ